MRWWILKENLQRRTLLAHPCVSQVWLESSSSLHVYIARRYIFTAMLSWLDAVSWEKGTKAPYMTNQINNLQRGSRPLGGTVALLHCFCSVFLTPVSICFQSLVFFHLVSPFCFSSFRFSPFSFLHSCIFRAHSASHSPLFLNLLVFFLIHRLCAE